MSEVKTIARLKMLSVLIPDANVKIMTHGN